MRVFIAIELPEAIKNQLAGLQSELKKSRADAAWVKPALSHITLKFLGEINEETCRKVFAAVNRTAGHFTPFAAALSSVDAFPSINSPRAIWAGIGEGAVQLKEIASRLELELAGEDIDTEEEREFKAHATIARTRSSANSGELARRLKEAAEKPFASPGFRVDAITVFKSTLSPKGPAYEPLLRAPLGIK